jgi:hypothetical protein
MHVRIQKFFLFTKKRLGLKILIAYRDKMLYICGAKNVLGVIQS